MRYLNMLFVSTGGCSPSAVSFRQTLLQPIPQAGHLWIPESDLPRVSWPAADRPLWEFVSRAVSSIVGENCDDACRRALEGRFPIALEKHDVMRVHMLQLHRGPTLSFKDVGCRVAAELHRQFLDEEEDAARVIVATSGDTGSAAAHAGFDRICVLYPKDRISPFQEAQMLEATNAVCMAVPGDFDACQHMAKRMLRFKQALSCNSVSLARLLPQIGMYAWAAAQAPDRVYVIPSGNYGNAVSCLMAKRMGAPIATIHMACNENGRALVRYLRGEAFIPSETKITPATAMDVGAPSNFVSCALHASG